MNFTIDKEDVMLHTILGIACFDPNFRRALFENPTTAVRVHNLYARQHDMNLLQAITKDLSLQSDFEAVAKGLCPHPPCPMVALGVLEVIGAALLDETFCDELFRDPIAAVNKQGFGFRYPETYVLTTLIYGANATALKQAIDTLGRKLAQVIDRAVMLEVA